MGHLIKSILAVFAVLIFLQAAHAADYYADIDIVVYQDGSATIAGTTNHPALMIKDSYNYTSKNKAYWMFNITLNDTFSEYIYSLTLPDSASINYVHSAGPFRIEESSGNLKIIGYGQNKPFSVVVQYELKKQTFDFTPFIWICSMAVILGVMLYYFKAKTKNKKTKEKRKKQKHRKQTEAALPEDKADYNFSGLSQRQKQIILLLIKNKNPMTQAEIQKQMKIPKASVSRNIKTLELKGKIEKEQAGMSNIVKLK